MENLPFFGLIMTTPTELATQLTNAANNVAIIDACSNIIQFFKLERDNPSANLVYATIADLPTANSMHEGMTAYVYNDAVYICDGTQWYDVVTPGTEPWKFQGQTEAVVGSSAMQTFPFASDVNSTSIGAISYARTRAAGCSGPVYAYQAGSTNYYPNSSQSSGNIMKFPFANPTTGSAVVGSITRNLVGSAGFNSETYGYSYGGNGQAYPSPYYNADVTNGYKFPFASDTNASTASYLYRDRSLAAGISAPEYGYTAGGFDLSYYYHPSPSIPNTRAYSEYVEKFPFASDTSRDSFWTFPYHRAEVVGQSSEDAGYYSGGMYGTPTYQSNQDDILKFPFASDNSLSNIGQLSSSRKGGAAASGVDYGYQVGGVSNSPPYPIGYTVIDKFPFASDTGASDVADLTLSISTGATGHQH
jgi:hypothetical protein